MWPNVSEHEKRHEKAILEYNTQQVMTILRQFSLIYLTINNIYNLKSHRQKKFAND